MQTPFWVGIAFLVPGAAYALIKLGLAIRDNPRQVLNEAIAIARAVSVVCIPLGVILVITGINMTIDSNRCHENPHMAGWCSKYVD